MPKPLFSHVLNLRQPAVGTSGLADGSVTAAKLAPGATVSAQLDGYANGGVAITGTETVLIELTPTIAAGRLTLILASLPAIAIGSTVQVTMNVRTGGTAGVADGTILLGEIRTASVAATVQVPLTVSGFVFSSAAITRLKLTATRSAGAWTVNTDWSPHLLLMQFT